MSEPAGRWLPLADLRVLDFSLLLPGPWATAIFGDLGADVIKVEPPGGDYARELRPPMFRAANRNKRSVVLDLKSPQAPKIVERLTRWADIAIESFRPGVAERLGIGYETLSKINPRLIYCSLSGFGQTGPDRMTPGHDLNYLAPMGAVSLSGHWGQAPRRSGIPIADLGGGVYATIAILSAVHDRERTGRGVQLDLSLAEAAFSFASVRNGLRAEDHDTGYLFPTNDLFETGDGRTIAFGLIEDRFWAKFAEAVSDVAPDLGVPEYRTLKGRCDDGDHLARRMREVLRGKPSAEWMEIFKRHDVPATLVATPAEASESPQLRAREMVQELRGQRHTIFPVMVNGRRGGELRRPAPELGEHTDAVFAELDT